MARRNTETSDITEQMGMHLTILKDFMQRDSSIDWYRMCGTRKRGLRVLCNGEEILELWSDNKDVSYDSVGSICTKYVDNASRKNAVPVEKHNYDSMGEDVFTTYAYHDDWRFKWSIHAKTYDDIRYEVSKCIQAYKKSHDF